MGNKHPKSQSGSAKPDVLSALTEEELRHLRKFYKTYEEKWKQHVCNDLLEIFFRYLGTEADKLSFETFASLFINLAKQPCSDIAKFTEALLSRENDYVSYEKVLKYVKAIICSYLLTLTATKDKVLLEWLHYGITNPEESQMLYAEALCGELENKRGEIDFEKWYCLSSQFQKLHTIFVYKLYLLSPESVTYKDKQVEKHLLPSIVLKEELSSRFSILSVSDIMFLNSSLPTEKQMEWRLCFSTPVHGLGFGKLMRMVVNQGSTLVIVRDKAGYVFGGYASESWHVGPKFYGTPESFLFTLYPKMKVYESTGYNGHYQYLNVQQKTFPNGLGMGGQLEYFGFWLDGEFGKGHCTESCSTYRNYKMLSATKNFEVDHVEIWSVFDIPSEDVDAEEGESILDKDQGTKALLEIAGKGFQSEGYRDKPNEPLL